MNTQTRAGMLALAGTAIALAAPLGAAGPTAGAKSPALDGASGYDALVPLRAAGTGGADAKKANGPLARRVERLAAQARRARARRPHFPIDGAFNWGQQAARFGAGRGGRSHEGQDVFARTGTPLVAVRDGVVLETGNDGGRGNYVAIYSPRGRATYVYLHMSRPAPVGVGDRVGGGQRVGAVGCTGSCWGPHLHFEVRRGRSSGAPPVNPLPRLRRWAAASSAAATLPPGAG